MKINKKLLMAALASAVIVSAPQAKTYTLSNAESVATNTGIGLSEEKAQAALRAPQEETEPNYAEDEKNVGFYKDTQLERGNGPAVRYTPPEEVDRFIDGFRYKTLEPSATSEDQTHWGFEIEFNKEEGQRTYTDFYFSNTGNFSALLNTGTIIAEDIGKIIHDSFKEVNYKSESEIVIDASGRILKSLNLYADKKDFERINSINNKNTVMAWEGHYTKDNPNGPKATEGGSAAFKFTVNPWPNENDKLNLITLSGSHDKKEFVQGQTINTEVKINNLDKNARERLVGQVYHPITGEVVPGAEAYINDQDKVVIKMPDGVIDENGNIKEDSIFYSDPNYKGLQNLEVKFFARPRTAAEFEAVSNEANYGEGAYTPTGAGTEKINHKGENVEIDLQGIDRYDHYNLIGGFKINLDDTRYYDQGFIDKNKDDTSKHTHSKVKPGEEFEVNLYVPEDKKDKDGNVNKDLFPNQKTPEEMEAAKSEKQAIGTIDTSFLDKQNEGKKPEDQWKLEYDDKTLPTTFKITPPKSAKAGDFVAVPLTYTYTNGSTDVHWFHFVVQESTNLRPEYTVKVDYPTVEQKSTPTLPDNPNKKLEPVRYELEPGAEFKDDNGNEWDVSIDETTGEVTAKPKNQLNFSGGEVLQVPVVAYYKDKNEPDKVITETNIFAEFSIKERFNKTPRYNAKAGKAGDELSSEVILDKNDEYNREPSKYSLASDKFVDDKGNTWDVTIDEDTGKVTATVPNAEEGKTIDGALLNVPVTAHYYEMQDGKQVETGTKEVEVQFVASGTEEKVEKILDVPFETKVEKDPELKKGEIRVIQEGEVGSKKVTYTIKDSKITDTKEEELKAPKERIIHVGEGVNDGEHKIEETVEVPYEVEIQFDDTLKPGEQVVFQEGEPGEKTRTTTITIQDGNVTNTQVGEFTETKAPQKKIIKVGANTEGKVEHKEEIPFKYTVEFDPEFHENYPDATDNYKVVTDGVAGEKTTTWTIKNSQIVEGPDQTVTKKPVDAVIKVGQKDYTGTFETKKTKAIEFKTEYKVDNSLEPGQVVVEQEGELGEEVTTVTHTIVNGKVTNSEDGETTRKEPKDRIVKVGPGATEGTHEYTNKIPFEYEIRVNPELKKGERKIIQKGEVGEEKYTVTIKNSEVVETSDPVVTKEAKKEIIEVGNEDYTGNIDFTDKEPIPFETKIEFDDSLKPGETRVEQEGELGERSKTRTLTLKNGEVTEIVEGEYTQTKAPKDKLIKVGRNTEGKVEHKEEIPFDYKVEYVDDLKKGEYRIAKPGKVGTKTTTWNIKNSQIDGEPTVTEEAPEDALIQVGKGTPDGTHDFTEKKEIPFETIIEYDDSLEPGEEKVVQEGKPGEQERTNTIVIENGKVKEIKEGTFETTTKPVNKIIKIGRKKT